jgi:predicted nucleic acid-binding protein
MAERNNWGEKKRESIKEMLNDLVTLDLADPEIIKSYVAIDQRNLSHPKGSRNMPHNDKWIAATAMAASALLLKTDQDFLYLHPDTCKIQYVDPTSRL